MWGSVRGRIDDAFIVLTTQRSGSTWLIDVLDGASGVVAEEELFLSRRVSRDQSLKIGRQYPRFQEGRIGYRPLATWQYLDVLFSQTGFIGFKLMYSQIRAFPDIWPFVMVRRVPIVHLVRRNYLDTLISAQIKSELGQAHFRQGDPAPKDIQITIDVSTLQRRIATLERRQRLVRLFLRLSGQPHLEVAYEDLVRDDEAFRSVLSFIGAETSSFTPSTRLRRIRTDSPSEAVRNWDQVTSELTRTVYAHLLE